MTVKEATAEMERLIEGLPANMVEAIQIGEKASSQFKTKPIRNVLVSGLGGSGIGGKIVSQLVWDSCTVPMQVVNDYRIPAWVGPDTLFIACSYSGNTEETLSTLEEAMARGAQVTCITSGGQLKAIAELQGFNLILIPGGQPPRTSFGYNALQQLFVLHAYGLIDSSFKADLAKAASLLQSEIGTIRSEAAVVANKLKGSIPIIYSETWTEGLAVRLRQQINENAKMLCWHHAFPEMNHNELVAWAGGSKDFSVMLLRSPEDHPGTQRRMELSKEIIGRYTDKFVELRPQGQSRIERAYYLIYLGDWISFYMAVDRGVDPVEIAVIDYFKAELAKW
jgi:glucose/mannose-6-phosphate isomerase